MHSVEQQIENPVKKLAAFGTDVAKNTFVVALMLSDNLPVHGPNLKKLKTYTFKRTLKGAQEFVQWARQQVPEGYIMHIVMEATGPYSLQLAAWLKQLEPVLSLAIIDPKRAKAYAVSLGVRNKTDQVDARVLAAYAVERVPVSDEPVDQIYLDLRALTRAREFLLEQKTAAKNHQEAQVCETLSTPVAKQITTLHKKYVDALQKQIDHLEEQIKQLVKQDDQVSKDVAQLDTIVGVGLITAVTVLAEFGDLRRFRNSRQLVAMAGLNPEIKQSGKWVGQSHLSKRGSCHARRALYMASLSIITSDSDFATFYNNLVEKSHKTKMVATCAVMRKLLVTMRAVIKTDTSYQHHHENAKIMAEIA